MSPKVTRIIFVTKSLLFMRFSSISINLLEFFRIMSFVFDLKCLSQNSINLNMLGVFWNPQDEQFLRLSLDLHSEVGIWGRPSWRPLYVQPKSFMLNFISLTHHWSSCVAQVNNFSEVFVDKRTYFISKTKVINYK